MWRGSSLGAENYGWFGQLNGKPAALLAVYQLPDANALDVANGVKAEMDRLSRGAFRPTLPIR